MVINIIGGSGFIGTRLCQRLVKDSEIAFTILDKNMSREFPALCNIADVGSVNELRNSISDGAVLINLAAEHKDDVYPRELFKDVNVRGAQNICSVARVKSISTIIFTSTVAVYGFAKNGTDEAGKIEPFSDYGRTKYEAEGIFRKWQSEDPKERTLVVIRPTVVFGENNRGNFYNLLNEIARRRFIMVGNGENRKSMAYVENLAAFIQYCTRFDPGIYVYNFVDKPDYSMRELVNGICRILGINGKSQIRIPYVLGFLIGKCFDIVARLSGRNFAVSAIRVKKFCSDSVFESAVCETGFVSPVPIGEALEKTIKYEFIEEHK
jgi:nucleoside-diphosphate-sugar epimerase